MDATRIPSRKLMRDFYELESLQNKGKNTDFFAEQSLKTIKENIASELSKYKICSSFFFHGESNPFKDSYVYILPLDSINNFKRTRPFFGIMATIFKRNEPCISIVNLPALKEIMYVEKSKGVWIEKINRNNIDPIKLTPSNISNIKDSSIMADNVASIFDFSDYIENFRDVEIINSPLYNLYSACHGLIDSSIISINSPFFYQSISLFISESKLNIKLLNDKYIISNNKIPHIHTS